MDQGLNEKDMPVMPGNEGQGLNETDMPELPSLDGNRNAITACIYFPDRSIPALTRKLLGRYPRASMSGLIVQLLQAVNLELPKLPKNEHRLVLKEVVIWL